MKRISTFLVIACLVSLCAALPRVLLVDEAQPDEYVMKHIASWADISISSFDDILMAEAAAILVDGAVYSKHFQALHALVDVTPIIIMNMTAEHKTVFIGEMTFGSPKASYAYSVLPFTDSNRVRHYKIVDVPLNNHEAKRASMDQNGQRSGPETANFELNFEESAKLFSNEIFACVTQGVFDPPTNMTPPQGALYAILPYSILGSYNVNLNDMNKPGSQTASHRLDNNFYNYRQNGFGEDGYYTVLMQDGIVNPGTLIIDDPSSAIGFYQFLFAIANQPYPNNVLPDSSSFYWAQSSPATVDQTITVTNSVSESLSLEIDMTVDGPSSKISVSWTASTSVSSEIEQWGIVEDTNPTNSTTMWTYHQQLPYDPFELNWNNFGSWYQSAYNGNNVASVPDLSTNTMQIHTISAWYAAGSLRNSDGTLPVLSTSDRNHQVAIICTPGYYNGHHHAEVWYDTFSDSFKMDLNSFPNNTAVDLL